LFIVPEEPECETLKVPVLRVFDGDGFLTRIHVPRRGVELEFTVRFGFIDAPEMGQPGGREARDFLQHLIADQWLDLAILTKMDTGGIVDRHGRVVAVPYLRQVNPPVDGLVSSLLTLTGRNAPGRPIFRNIELEMVLNGWAWVLDRYEPDERYFLALGDAQRNRRGIWARDNNIHPWEFKKTRYREKQRGRSQPSPQPTLFDCPEVIGPCPAEGCAGHIVTRSGKFGDFFGCSKFPKCRYSRSMHA
jgi:endonuclease YncB( thermonuclease family)